METGSDARALSQGEIDALLSKLSSESEQVETRVEQGWRVVKAYDFRRPDKLSKDQMRTLQLLHESFARLAGSSLSAYLRAAVQMNLVSIDQGVYGEYIEQVPPDTVLHILNMDPLPGSVLMGIDLKAAMAAVDRLLGGAGAFSEAQREPTEIELALIQTMVTQMLKGLADAWSRVTELSPRIRDVVLDPRFVQVALRSDPVVVIAFEIGILHNLGTVTLCLPYVVLEPVIPKLTAQLWFSGAQRGGVTQTEQLRQSLESVNVELMVELGSAWLTLKELGHLKEGDVILLDRAIDQRLDVLVGGRRKFVARPGMVGNKVAVQIVGKAEEVELLEKARQGVVA